MRGENAEQHRARYRHRSVWLDAVATARTAEFQHPLRGLVRRLDCHSSTAFLREREHYGWQGGGSRRGATFSDLASGAMGARPGSFVGVECQRRADPKRLSVWAITETWPERC